MTTPPAKEPPPLPSKKWLESRDPTNIFGIYYSKPAKRKSLGSNSPSVQPAPRILHHDGYVIGPDCHVMRFRAQWEKLHRYRAFTVGQHRMQLGDCILVRHEDPASESDDSDSKKPKKKKKPTARRSSARTSSAKVDTQSDPSLAKWKAKVHEIRALDAYHVYLLVSWFDRPAHDLDSAPGKKEGKVYGEYELVASTQVDVINATTAEGRVEIGHWDGEEGTRPGVGKYYWRERFDFVTKRLGEGDVKAIEQ